VEQVIIGGLECVRETEDAMLLESQIDYEIETMWVPKSVILDTDIECEGDTGEVTVPYWFANDQRSILAVSRAIEESQRW